MENGLEQSLLTSNEGVEEWESGQDTLPSQSESSALSSVESSEQSLVESPSIIYSVEVSTDYQMGDMQGYTLSDLSLNVVLGFALGFGLALGCGLLGYAIHKTMSVFEKIVPTD